MSTYKHFFSNVELSNLVNVSEGTVRRWIKEARAGKLDLDLYFHDGKPRIANTVKNMKETKDLAKLNKQRSKRWRGKIVRPADVFYKLYNKNQVVDIISNLEIYREIPKQYSYFGAGAQRWDAYAKRLWNEEKNTLNATVELLHDNTNNLLRLLGDCERVNVIDIGVGNALPVKELLTKLLHDEMLLGRYIAVDISEDMLKIAERNITKWFNGEINFEGHVRDITYQRFGELLIDEDNGEAINLILLLGGTLSNVRSPNEVLQVIHRGLRGKDLFVTSSKLDSEEARRYFDFHTEEDRTKLPLDRRLMLEHLGLNESMYKSEQGYDEAQRVRFHQVRLKMDVTIEFFIDDKRHTVELSKGDAIILWRAWHQSSLDVVHQLDSNGFALRALSTTENDEYILSISQIKKGSRSGFKVS